MNVDPRDQVNECINIHGLEATKELYRQHGVTDAALQIILKPVKSRQDFYDFITERVIYFAGQLEQYGSRRPVGQLDDEELDDDDL